MIENYNYCTIFGIERPASTCNGHVRDPWHVNRPLVERKTVENSYNCVSATSRGKLATPLRQQTSWRRAASDSVRCVVSLYVHSFATIIMLKMMTMMTMVLQQYSSSRFSVALQSKAGRLFFSFSGKPKPIVGWFVCSCFLAHKIWSFFGVAFFAPFIPFLVTRKSLSIYIHSYTASGYSGSSYSQNFTGKKQQEYYMDECMYACTYSMEYIMRARRQPISVFIN